jgi:two-component system nitrate/nitrite sensor histidine kinase NarX
MSYAEKTCDLNASFVSLSDQIFAEKIIEVIDRRFITPVEELFRQNLEDYIRQFNSLNEGLESLETEYEKDSGCSYFEDPTGVILVNKEDGSILDASNAALDLFGYPYSRIAGMRLETLIHPICRSIFSDYIWPSGQSTAFRGMSIFNHSNSSSFYGEFFGTEFTYSGSDSLIFFIKKIPDGPEAAEMILNWTNRQMKEQSDLIRILQTMSSNLELDPDMTMDLLRNVVPYSLGVFFELDKDSIYALSMNGSGQAPFLIKLDDLAEVRLFFGKNVPVFIPDILSDDQTSVFIRTLFIKNAPSFLVNKHSWLMVPILIDETLSGCICVAHNEKDYFNNHHARLVSIIAEQAATKLRNAKIFEKEQMVGALQERQNLAHNLHDTVNQSLFSAGLIAEVLPHLWNTDANEGKKSLTDISRLIRGAQAEIRIMLVDLRPATLMDVELSDLLHLLAKAFMGRTNIPIEVSIYGKCALQSKVQTVCYHVCQEALNNIAKHSRASKVDIILFLDDGGFNLSINDNGRGFDRRREGINRSESPIDISIRDNIHGFNPKYIPFEHYGLRMMYDQAENIGAVLKVITQPGHGTQISLQWKGSTNR